MEFTYDGRQRLRVRKDYTWNTGYGAWQLSAETRYVYDGMRVIQERNSGNTPTVAYTRGVDLSGTLEGAGGIGGLLARSHGYSGGSWSTHSYYHADGGGNVTYLVNSGQAMVASYRYDPYGRLLSSSGSLASANVMRFSSKAWIAHNGSATDGLYSYGYRFYDPNLQRWPNRDPIQEEGGINLYAFVNNSPIDWIDDFGDQARPPMPGRPWPGMPGGPRNRGGPSHRYPNAPLPYIPPRSPNPKNQWPGGRQPAMCIRIQLVSERAIEGAEMGEGVAKHLLSDPSKPCPPPPPSPCPPRGPSLPPYIPNSGSYVNAPPDIGLTTPPTPPRPPRIIFLPRDSGPVIVAPGTIIIWY